MKKIAVLGVGYFGYAILKHFDQKHKKHDGDFEISAYDVDPRLMDNLEIKRKHLYLFKSTKLSGLISFKKDLKEAVRGAEIIILAVDSKATRMVLKEVKKYLLRPVILVNVAKALDYETGKRLSEVAQEVLGAKLKSYACFAGGTIAKDLFKHESLGANIACTDKKVLEDLADIFSSDNLFIYPTLDLEGTEYAAAFKNAVAILAGITKGLGFSYGSETHIISRAGHEVEKLIKEKFSAQKETFSLGSQCWGNDLLMSCTGDTRNRKFGIEIGEGCSVGKALKKMKKEHKTVEGVKTISVLDKICDLEEFPTLNLLSNLLKEKISLKTFKESIFVNIRRG